MQKIEKLLNSYKYKNSLLAYNIANVFRYYTPRFLLRPLLPRMLARAGRQDNQYISERVNYYNKLAVKTPLPADATALADFKYNNRKKGRTAWSVYFFDTYRYTRFFPDSMKIRHEFGDVTTVPQYPSIVKSRPAAGDNANSVLLNLNKRRHFMFLKDKKNFRDKKDMLVGRGVVEQPHRIKFWQMYFNHPMCDLGAVNKNPQSPYWIKKFMGIDEHLDYKFILCLEGNDVATNLKWVMSSNSLAVTARPKYETWFMEGRLIPNYHYVEIKPDYSDLEERLNYYIARPREAEQIIANAHAWIAQFGDKKREDLISLQVLQKYFEMTN